MEFRSLPPLRHRPVKRAGGHKSPRLFHGTVCGQGDIPLDPFLASSYRRDWFSRVRARRADFNGLVP